MKFPLIAVQYPEQPVSAESHGRHRLKPLGLRRKQKMKRNSIFGKKLDGLHLHVSNSKYIVLAHSQSTRIFKRYFGYNLPFVYEGDSFEPGIGHDQGPI